MRLFLVQHGEAVSKESDPKRPLSAQGERDVENLATFLQRADIRAEHVLHSGKRRAQQTAQVLARAVTASGQSRGISGIGPNDPIEPFVKTIATFRQDTVLVGHLPFLSRLVSQLVTSDPERTMVAFHPGSVVCLEGEPSDMFAIIWMVRPELLEKG